MKKNIILILILLISFSCSRQEKFIRQSISEELKHYPEASLADVYKNFFQDAYGPAHIIPDTASAGAYLSEELTEPFWTDTLKWQVLGSSHDYYRINLMFVKEGILPRHVLLEGMVKSAPLARSPDIESWKKEWAGILRVIEQMRFDFPGFEADKKRIDEMLARGEVVMHHSSHYVDTYHPHYRIVHRSVFERWKNKYLKN